MSFTKTITNQIYLEDIEIEIQVELQGTYIGVEDWDFINQLLSYDILIFDSCEYDDPDDPSKKEKQRYHKLVEFKKKISQDENFKKEFENFLMKKIMQDIDFYVIDVVDTYERGNRPTVVWGQIDSMFCLNWYK